MVSTIGKAKPESGTSSTNDQIFSQLDHQVFLILIPNETKIVYYIIYRRTINLDFMLPTPCLKLKHIVNSIRYFFFFF